MDLVNTLLHYITQSRGQAGNAQDLGSGAFEKIRELARLSLARGITTGASFAPGADLRPRTDIQRTCPGRSEQRFVPGKGKQVDVQRLHVDRHNAGRLRSIDEEQQI